MDSKVREALRGGKFLGRAQVSFCHDVGDIIATGRMRQDFYALPNGEYVARATYPSDYPWDREEIISMDVQDQFELVLTAIEDRWNIPLRMWMGFKAFLLRIIPW